MRRRYWAVLLMVSLSLVVASPFSAEASARERIEVACAGPEIARAPLALFRFRGLRRGSVGCLSGPSPLV